MPEAGEGLRSIQNILEQVEDQLRRLSHELHPTMLDDLGLVPALRFLAEGVARRSEVAIAVRVRWPSAARRKWKSHCIGSRRKR